MIKAFFITENGHGERFTRVFKDSDELLEFIRKCADVGTVFIGFVTA